MISEETKKSIRTNTTKVILNVPNELNGIFKELAQKRGISKSSLNFFVERLCYKVVAKNKKSSN